MTIEIQVHGGKVTISVGGRPVPDEPTGKITNQHIAGAPTATTKTTKAEASASQKAASEISAARRRPVKGTGPPTEKSAIGSGESMSGVLVIGPIVIGCGAENDTDDRKGAGPSTEKAAIGNGAPLSGAVVIGPIVIGVGTGATGAETDTDNNNPRPTAVTHLPGDPE